MRVVLFFPPANGGEKKGREEEEDDSASRNNNSDTTARLHTRGGGDRCLLALGGQITINWSQRILLFFSLLWGRFVG